MQRGRMMGFMLALLLTKGGPMVWVLLLAGAVAAVVFIERRWHYHKVRINTTEFIGGLKNVLRQRNIVEAISICDATPGPTARLVKTAILNRSHSRDVIKESLERAGATEVAYLEMRLGLLATFGKIAPLLGLLGTVLGFIKVFMALESLGAYANVSVLSGGILESLLSTAMGLAVGIPCYAGYNYLVGELGSLVLEMEKTSVDALQLVADTGTENAKAPSA